MTAGFFLRQVVLDSQGSLVGPDLLVRLWGRIFPDLWETLASLDWMESMVNTFPQSNFISFPFLSFPSSTQFPFLCPFPSSPLLSSF